MRAAKQRMDQIVSQSVSIVSRSRAGPHGAGAYCCFGAAGL